MTRYRIPIRTLLIYGILSRTPDALRSLGDDFPGQSILVPANGCEPTERGENRALGK